MLVEVMHGVAVVEVSVGAALAVSIAKRALRSRGAVAIITGVGGALGGGERHEADTANVAVGARGALHGTGCPQL